MEKTEPTALLREQVLDIIIEVAPQEPDFDDISWFVVWASPNGLNDLLGLEQLDL